MSVCVITPSLPPRIDGIADYSFNLYKHWPAQSEALRPSHFLVLHDLENSRSAFPNLNIQYTGNTAKELAAALESVNAKLVILQYSGYAFDRCGAPQWLPEGLQAWKDAAPDRRCAVMFHELFARANFWRRTFWHSIRQKAVARKLLQLASVAVTSNEYYRQELLKLDPAGSPTVIPIGSNLAGGQSIAEKDWQQVVIFGRSRLAAIQRHSAFLKWASDAGLITRLVLAGECPKDLIEREAKLVRATGYNAAVETVYNFEEVPDVVRKSGLALMGTQTTYLHKSSAFHLAIASGQVAIAEREHNPGHPLQEGVNYLAYDTERPVELLELLGDKNRLQEISSSAKNTATEHFSWEKISQAWCQLVEREETIGR